MSAEAGLVGEQKAQLTAALMEMGDLLEPLLDAAEGKKQELERRGWSPTAAEAVALEMLLGMLRVAFAPQAVKK